ncbi:hypothetical protein HDV00_011489 [Rhizophlyctis rosea]|nr:hypothetical protein HDV00_011489 [Rhizophlyctis rosea]
MNALRSKLSEESADEQSTAMSIDGAPLPQEDLPSQKGNVGEIFDFVEREKIRMENQLRANEEKMKKLQARMDFAKSRQLKPLTV